MSRRTAALLLQKAASGGLRLTPFAPEYVQARRLRHGLVPTRRCATSVLIISPRDWAAHVQWEAMFAQALTLRGADVRVLSCMGGLTICDRVNTFEGPPPPCATCSQYSRRAWGAHGFPVEDVAIGFGEHEDDHHDDLWDFEALRGDMWRGVAVGEIAFRTARWFLLNSAVTTDPLGPTTVRQFVKVARHLVDQSIEILDRVRPDAIFMLNGKFLFEAIVSEIAERRNIRVISYERGQVHGTLFVAHGPHAPEYDVTDAWEAGGDRPLITEEEQELDGYLASRRAGTISYVDLWPSSRSESETAPADRPRVVIFTNVTWDTAAHGSNSAFSSMTDWLAAVLRACRRHPEADFVLRIHPAEVRIKAWQTREPTNCILDDLLSDGTPKNLRVVAADDDLDSYQLMDTSAVGLVYTSTTGLELALNGVPTITAGGPHYSNKGFTLDATSSDHLEELLGRVLGSPEAHRPDVELARRYAHLFFFRVPVKVPPVQEPAPGLAELMTTDHRDLLPGVDGDLDRVCEAILQGLPLHRE